MARVPEAQLTERTQAAPFVPQSSSSATLDAFGPRPSAALTQGLAAVGDTAFDIALKQKEEDNEREAKSLDVQYQDQIRKITYGDENIPGYYSLKGDAAVNGARGAQDAIQQAGKDFINAASNPAVARMFTKVVQGREPDHLNRVFGHTNEQRLVANKAASIGRVESALADVSLNPKDQETLDRSMYVVQSEAIAQAKAAGVTDPVAMQRILDEAVGKVHETTITGMVTRDAPSARAYYDTYRHEIDGLRRKPIETMLRESLSGQRSVSYNRLLDAIAAAKEDGTQIEEALFQSYGATGANADEVQIMREKAATAQAFYGAYSRLRDSNPAEVMALLHEYNDPERPNTRFDRQNLLELQNRATKLLADRTADPASAAIKESPVVRTWYQNAIRSGNPMDYSAYAHVANEWQKDKGINPGNRRLLGKGEAERMVADHFAVTPQKTAETLTKLQNQWGSAWPQVWKELSAAKMPASAQILGSLVMEGKLDGAKLLAEASQNADALEKAADPTVYSDDKKDLRSRFEDFAKAESGRMNAPKNVQAHLEAATNLAAFLRMRGDSDPVGRAFDTLLGNHKSFTSGRFLGNVPADAADAIEDYGNMQTRTITGEAVADPGGADHLSPEQRKAAYARRMQLHGVWTVNGAGDGMVLVDSRDKLPFPASFDPASPDFRKPALSFTFDDARRAKAPAAAAIEAGVGASIGEAPAMSASERQGRINSGEYIDEFAGITSPDPVVRPDPAPAATAQPAITGPSGGRPPVNTEVPPKRHEPVARRKPPESPPEPQPKPDVPSPPKPEQKPRASLMPPLTPKQQKLPGFVNNNPGNIRPDSANKWEGMSADQSQARGNFVKFDRAEDGIRAMAILLSKYGNTMRNTLGTIIPSYAPAVDRNNEAAYISSVAKRLGVSADTNLNQDKDPEMLRRLMKAMILHENANETVPDAVFDAGFKAAMDDKGVKWRVPKGARKSATIDPSERPEGIIDMIKGQGKIGESTAEEEEADADLISKIKRSKTERDI